MWHFISEPSCFTPVVYDRSRATARLNIDKTFKMGMEQHHQTKTCHFCSKKLVDPRDFEAFLVILDNGSNLEWSLRDSYIVIGLVHSSSVKMGDWEDCCQQGLSLTFCIFKFSLVGLKGKGKKAILFFLFFKGRKTGCYYFCTHFQYLADQSTSPSVSENDFTTSLQLSWLLLFKTAYRFYRIV